MKDWTDYPPDSAWRTGLADALAAGPPHPERNQGQPRTMVGSQSEKLGDGADGGGKRLNAGKLRTDLTPPEWLYALADVTTQGSKKYTERNWELGMKWSTMVGCIYRHMFKFQAGERYDGIEFDIEKGTTGCHHLAMIAWNALALMSYDLREIGENDLPTEVQLKLFDRTNAQTSDLGLHIWLKKDDES